MNDCLGGCRDSTQLAEGNLHLLLCYYRRMRGQQSHMLDDGRCHNLVLQRDNCLPPLVYKNWSASAQQVTKTVKFRHCSCFTCFLLLPSKLFGQPEQSQTLITDLQVVFFIQMYLLIFHRNKIESISVLFSWLFTLLKCLHLTVTPPQHNIPRKLSPRSIEQNFSAEP